jgi:branched-chain amino acid transport system substrate-binding protein
LFALKQAIEASGWKQKSDDKGVIEALEGLKMENSAGFAQGAKVLRKEDHSGMIDCYISRIENDEFHVKKKVTKEEMTALLPPRFDFSKQPL